MNATTIPWTDKSINPGIYGCSPAGAGCRNCYAMKKAHRLACMGQDQYIGAAIQERGSARWSGDVRVDFDRIPVAFSKLPKKKACRVFCTSMGDLFHEDVPAPFVGAVFAAMAARPHITFQVLTKRPHRVNAYLPGDWWNVNDCDNIQIGASCSTQADVDRLVPELLRVPAAVRFLSLEPLLEPVDLTSVSWPGCGDPAHRVDVLRAGYWNKAGWRACGPAAQLGEPRGGFTNHSNLQDSHGTIGWVIVGAESGPNRRPCKLEWVKGEVNQCQDAGVPVLVKQLDLDGKLSRDHSEWPEWARVQEFPEVPK